MNRLVKYNIDPSIITGRYDRHLFTLIHKDDRQLFVKKQELDSGQSLILIPFTLFDGKVIPVVTASEWVLDLDETSINEAGFIGGVLDGLGLVTEAIYHIWAFADNNGLSKGFGLAQEPTSTFQTTGAAKGAEITITNMTKAYRFTIGARLRVEHNNVTTAVNDTDWNLATITEISSATQIKALMDNDNIFGATYGAAIPAQASTGGLITQLNMFRPYTADDSNQGVIHPYYRLIGLLITDDTAAPDTLIEGFEKMAQHSPPLGSIQAWHKDLSGNFPLLTDEWKPCDGLVCKVDQSPFIGTVLPDLNGDGRFLRGSGTSGTNQAATIVWNRSEDDTIVCCTRNSTMVKNGDGNVTDTVDITSTGTGNITTDSVSSNFTKVRPVNMSVVWIIKVK